MKILIVEDDSYKFTQICALVKSTIPTAEITHFDSVHGVVRYLRKEIPDKLILDMALPTHPPVAGEGSPVSMSSGGVEVLLELRRLQINDLPIAILTQYPDFEIEDDYYELVDAPDALFRHYGLKNIVSVYYEHGDTEWVLPIENFLNN